MLKSEQKLKITNKVKEQPTNFLLILKDEYDHEFRKEKRNFKKFGIHLILRRQCKKGWKKLERETRRYTYNAILKEIERRIKEC